VFTLQNLNIDRSGFWYENCYLVIISQFIMSKEVLEFSILVDEKFDMSFNLAEGIFGFFLRFFD